MDSNGIQFEDFPHDLYDNKSESFTKSSTVF